MTQEAPKLSTSDLAAALDKEKRDAEVIERDRAERERQHAVATQTSDDAAPPLFAEDELGGYRTRWGAIQTGFVDEPRKAVEEADTLVVELMRRLAEVFSDERRRLETQWEKADQVSTEDLRLAMRRYRFFFERLLSI